jgi:hypothetical protein
MLIMTMLLLMAAPVADRVRIKHPPRMVRPVKVARKARRIRRPISMSVIKPQSLGCRGEVACVTGTSRSRYRLPLPRLQEPTDKDMALAEDGTRCALIGQTICPRRTRTIIQLGEASPRVPAEAVIK